MNRVLAVAAVLVLALFAVIAISRRDFEAPPGEELQLDDMAFSLVSHRTSPSLLGGPAPKNGVFHVVGVRAANCAKRVDHRTGPFAPVLETADGRLYPVSDEGQKALDVGRTERGWGDRLLRRGEAAEAEWVFDAPAALDGAVVRIVCNGPLLQIAEDIVFGRRRLRLPPPDQRPL